MKAIDITDRIERNEKAERNFAVELRALYASAINDGDARCEVIINGELMATIGDHITRDVQVFMVIYDDQDRVMTSGKELIGADGFFECQAFAVSAYTNFAVEKISRVKVYPQGY